MRIEIVPLDVSRGIKKILVGRQSLSCCPIRFYLLDGIDKDVIGEKGHCVFADAVTERWHVDEYTPVWQSQKPDFVAEVSPLPGVTDNSACAAVEGLELLGLGAKWLREECGFFGEALLWRRSESSH